MFHSGKLAGCVVTDKLLETVEKYAAGPDKGKKFFLELAAKQLAVFKGLGFAAGYIGGMAKADTFGQIIDMAESFGPTIGATSSRKSSIPSPASSSSSSTIHTPACAIPARSIGSTWIRCGIRRSRRKSR